MVLAAVPQRFAPGPRPPVTPRWPPIRPMLRWTRAPACTSPARCSSWSPKPTAWRSPAWWTSPYQFENAHRLLRDWAELDCTGFSWGREPYLAARLGLRNFRINDAAVPPAELYDRLHAFLHQHGASDETG